MDRLRADVIQKAVSQAVEEQKADIASGYALKVQLPNSDQVFELDVIATGAVSSASFGRVAGTGFIIDPSGFGGKGATEGQYLFAKVQSITGTVATDITSNVSLNVEVSESAHEWFEAFGFRRAAKEVSCGLPDRADREFVASYNDNTLIPSQNRQEWMDVAKQTIDLVRHGKIKFVQDEHGRGRLEGTPEVLDLFEQNLNRLDPVLTPYGNQDGVFGRENYFGENHHKSFQNIRQQYGEMFRETRAQQIAPSIPDGPS